MRGFDLTFGPPRVTIGWQLWLRAHESERARKFELLVEQSRAVGAVDEIGADLDQGALCTDEHLDVLADFDHVGWGSIGESDACRSVRSVLEDGRVGRPGCGRPGVTAVVVETRPPVVLPRGEVTH